LEAKRVIAYKFLSCGAVGLYSGFRWPTPSAADEPGSWVTIEGGLLPGRNAVHACPPGELVGWIDDELWVVELAGEIAEHEGVLLASRARLLRRLEQWTAETAREFSEACVFRTAGAAVAALRHSGDHTMADELAHVGDLAELEARAAAAAASRKGFAAIALGYAADAVVLSRGERPEHYGAHPALPAVSPTPGAIAANLGFVAAHAVGCANADATGDKPAYETGFTAERERQRAWLLQRLRLDAPPRNNGA
jgi:hypothetical protein